MPQNRLTRGNESVPPAARRQPGGLQLPWGPEALALAREREVPILLSIGYAACHWCHVMAHESFEDPHTAALMNERFVSVKVDREERPDLDAIYMQAVQAMTGQGGWPMTVFLTPAGEPFYGGTYFPPDNRHGMPSFRRVLLSVSDAWLTRRNEVDNAVATIAEMYAAAGAIARADAPVTAATLDAALADILRRFEPMAGGFGGAPKFPHAMTLDFALRQWGRKGNERARHVAEHSFVQMIRGGIYDQLGGGFHRYAVDAQLARSRTSRRCCTTTRCSRCSACTSGRRPGNAEVRRDDRGDAVAGCSAR